MWWFQVVGDCRRRGLRRIPVCTAHATMLVQERCAQALGGLRWLPPSCPSAYSGHQRPPFRVPAAGERGCHSGQETVQQPRTRSSPSVSLLLHTFEKSDASSLQEGLWECGMIQQKKQPQPWTQSDPHPFVLCSQRPGLGKLLKSTSLQSPHPPKKGNEIIWYGVVRIIDNEYKTSILQ